MSNHLKVNDLALVIGLPRYNDGIGYHKNMQAYYKMVGRITQLHLTLNTHTGKEEKYYDVYFLHTGKTWALWERNLRKFPVKYHQGMGCIICKKKIRFGITARLCMICGGLVCKQCRDQHYNLLTKACYKCEEELESQRLKYRKNISANQLSAMHCTVIIEKINGSNIIPRTKVRGF